MSGFQLSGEHVRKPTTLHCLSARSGFRIHPREIKKGQLTLSSFVVT